MIKENIESILKFFKELENKQKTDESILLCIHCDHSGHVKGSLSQIELFSFNNLNELANKLKPYEDGNKMTFSRYESRIKNNY